MLYIILSNVKPETNIRFGFYLVEIWGFWRSNRQSVALQARLARTSGFFPAPYLTHEKKHPNGCLIRGGTPVLKSEPCFNHERTKCVVRAYNLLKVLPTTQLMREKKQNFYRRYLLHGNQHANHL